MSERPTKLSKGLKQRHLTMIAISGVIGAGLSVGADFDDGRTEAIAPPVQVPVPIP
jgi:GABA permease